jgi:hypothetical protein
MNGVKDSEKSRTSISRELKMVDYQSNETLGPLAEE